MSVTADILATYRRPGAVIRRKLAEGPQEDRAFAVLMGAATLGFVAQWPRLSRAAYVEPEVPLDARLGAALLAQVFIVPLVAYIIAGIIYFIQRLAGGKASSYGTRLALFWSLLAVSPLMLLHGLMSGLVGPGPQTQSMGVLVAVVFITIWAVQMREVVRG